MDYSDKKAEFLVEEYKQLRQEMTLFFQRIDASERNALLSSGAIWAWLATHEHTGSYNIVVWVPMVICVMFALKAVSLRYGTYRLGKYIKGIEETLGLEEGLGWQKTNRMIPKGYPIGIGGWPVVYWSSIIILNAIAAYVFPEFITNINAN